MWRDASVSNVSRLHEANANDRTVPLFEETAAELVCCLLWLRIPGGALNTRNDVKPVLSVYLFTILARFNVNVTRGVPRNYSSAVQPIQRHPSLKRWKFFSNTFEVRTKQKINPRTIIEEKSSFIIHLNAR